MPNKPSQNPHPSATQIATIDHGDDTAIESISDQEIALEVARFRINLAKVFVPSFFTLAISFSAFFIIRHVVGKGIFLDHFGFLIPLSITMFHAWPVTQKHLDAPSSKCLPPESNVPSDD